MTYKYKTGDKVVLDCTEEEFFKNVGLGEEIYNLCFANGVAGVFEDWNGHKLRLTNTYKGYEELVKEEMKYIKPLQEDKEVTKEIKPFYIDADKHNLSAEEANRILDDCVNIGGVNLYEYYITSEYQESHPDRYSVKDLPYFGVSKFNNTCTIGASRFDPCYTEINPEDLNTWISHGLTKYEYVEKSMKHLEVMQENIVTEDSFKKPTLGLLPRKQWLQLRQYEIVRALNRQVEAYEVLNKEWVEELACLVKEVGDE